MAKKEKTEVGKRSCVYWQKPRFLLALYRRTAGVHQRGSGHRHAVEQLLGNVPGTYGSPTGGEGRDGWDRPGSCEPEQPGCTAQLTLG